MVIVSNENKDKLDKFADKNKRLLPLKKVVMSDGSILRLFKNSAIGNEKVEKLNLFGR